MFGKASVSNTAWSKPLARARRVEAGMGTTTGSLVNKRKVRSLSAMS
jgi:hypothetical protein